MNVSWNYSPGDRVRVIREPGKYKGLVGATGIVKSAYASSISVKLDGFTNPKGSTGYFYFGPMHLEPADDFLAVAAHWYPLDEYIQKDIESTYKLVQRRKALEKEKEETPMLKNYRVASIKFQDDWKTDKTYPYALYDEDIAIGDTVVVMTGHHGMTIAEVCAIGKTPKDSVTCGREIICKVDMTAYNDRKAKAKKMAELKVEMDAKVKALQEVALYELMAEKDPELKAMLEAFKALEQ